MTPCVTTLQVSIHNRVGNIRSGDLFSAEPPAVEAVDGFRCVVHRRESEIYLSLLEYESQ